MTELFMSLWNKMTHQQQLEIFSMAISLYASQLSQLSQESDDSPDNS